MSSSRLARLDGEHAAVERVGAGEVELAVQAHADRAGLRFVLPDVERGCHAARIYTSSQTLQGVAHRVGRHRALAHDGPVAGLSRMRAGR